MEWVTLQVLWLVGNALAVVNAVNGWHALSRRGLLSGTCFAAGWWTSELPLLVLFWLAVGEAVGLVLGALDGPLRWLNLVLGLVAAAFLAALQISARRSGPVFEAALEEGLGSGYAGRVVQPRRPEDEAVTARTPGVVRMLLIRRRFAHTADVRYGPADGRGNLLDIWRRRDLPADGRAPVLIQIPGGAWMMGNKQGQAYPLMSHLAERGWVCVAINYRLSPRHTWPAHIMDVKRAIAWVRANIAAYGGDPSFVAITGGSAGGHLASLAALTANDPAWQPGFEDADTSVSAAVPFYGAYDWTDTGGVGNVALLPFLERAVAKTTLRRDRDLFQAASPIWRITSEAPPFFVSHGTNDSLVPVEQARNFVDLLRQTSPCPVVYAELPRAQHAFDVLGTPRAAQAALAVEQFLGFVYGARGGDGGTAARPART